MINQVNLIWIMGHQIEEDSIRTKIQKLVQTKQEEVWQAQRTLKATKGKLWRRFLPFMLNDQDLYLINLDRDLISHRVMLFMLRLIHLRQGHII